MPSVDGKAVVLSTYPCYGTAGAACRKSFHDKGTPSHVYIVSVVAAPEGIRLLREHLTLPYSLWTCAADEKLDARAYIVPGLGDAGGLAMAIADSSLSLRI